MDSSDERRADGDETFTYCEYTWNAAGYQIGHNGASGIDVTTISGHGQAVSNNVMGKNIGTVPFKRSDTEHISDADYVVVALKKESVVTQSLATFIPGRRANKTRST